MRLAEGFSSETSLGLCRGQAALFLLPGGRPTPKLLLSHLQSSLLYQSPTTCNTHFTQQTLASAAAAAAAAAAAESPSVPGMCWSAAKQDFARMKCRRHREQHGGIAAWGHAGIAACGMGALQHGAMGALQHGGMGALQHGGIARSNHLSQPELQLCKMKMGLSCQALLSCPLLSCPYSAAPTQLALLSCPCLTVATQSSSIPTQLPGILTERQLFTRT